MQVMFKERRRSPRKQLQLPMSLPDRTPGLTRNVSADGEGLYFTMSHSTLLDTWLYVEFVFSKAGLRFVAVGEIVRRDQGAEEDGAAMRLHASRLLADD